MSERIHRVIDGELSRAELTREERALLADFEATIGAAERTLERYEAPDLSAGVMARIAALDAPATTAPALAAARPASRVLRALEWLWTPRAVSLRPAWALGAAVLVVSLLATLPEVTRQAAPATASAAPEIYVHFRLDAPAATTVHLAGDFTDWEPAYELHQSQPGVWTVVVPLEPGVHDYAFVIDGETWTPDPLATTVDDGFGGENSRLSLLPPERMRA
jgi:hypothetical protein